LKTAYKIRDRNGVRHVPEDGFPIIIGGSPNADIRIPTLEAHEQAANIGLAEEGAFVQAGQSGIPILYNRQKLKDLVWLHHGDKLQIGSSEIEFLVEDDGTTFRVIEPEKGFESISRERADTMGDVLEIEPISFRPPHRLRRSKPFTQYRWLIAVSAVSIFVFLSILAWVVFTARQVVIRIDPEPDRISISGSLIAISGSLIAPRWASYYLLRPGEYTLQASKECYQPIEKQFQVTDKKSQEITFLMEKLPGRFSLMVHHLDQPSAKLDGARIYVDGREVGIALVTGIKVKSGQRRVEIRAENYQDLITEVVIEGCNELQSFDFALVPDWSEVFISSIPRDAKVLVDGNLAGQTPVKIELLDGTYQLEIGAAGFKTWKTRLDIQANHPQTLEDIRLEPADGTLSLRTNPPGANVTVGKTYVGQTPLKIDLLPGTQHEILISKSGYEKISREIEVATAELKELTVNLKPSEGMLLFTMEPADAELFVDGKSWGTVPQKLKLIATSHQLEIKKKGYKSYRTQITPRPGFPQELKIVLKRIDSDGSEPLKVIKAKNGYPLKLIRPATFIMGSSRREQGRRSNETLRRIQLKRPFYMGVREVTNKEFKEFLSRHNSGTFKGHRLDRNGLPVVQVTWEQAAMYCNWLSARESLSPAYVKKEEKLVAAEPLGTGYRLPTEAEWEYCARFKNNQTSLKYPWGDKFPPTSRSGNYADISAKELLPAYLESYNDGYPATAPPAESHANDLGLYDLGGNVAEWCHDYYSIYSYNQKKVYFDPLGPQQGKHRVVRGASWKHAGISTLRLAYRDYSDDKRPDLGFRICRYFYANPKMS